MHAYKSWSCIVTLVDAQQTCELLTLHKIDSYWLHQQPAFFCPVKHPSLQGTTLLSRSKSSACEYGPTQDVKSERSNTTAGEVKPRSNNSRTDKSASTFLPYLRLSPFPIHTHFLRTAQLHIHDSCAFPHKVRDTCSFRMQASRNDHVSCMSRSCTEVNQGDRSQKHASAGANKV